MRHISLPLLLGGFVALLVAPAAASVTIGQLAPGTPPSNCNSFTTEHYDSLQPSVSSGNSYVVPNLGPALVVTSWSTNASPGSYASFTLKMWRKVGGATYQVVGHEGPHQMTPGLNTNPAGIPVRPGDVLGFSRTPGQSACFFPVSGDSFLNRQGDLADQESGAFSSYSTARLNISAVVTVSNSFTLGGSAANKRRGTATLTVNVPNPGELTASGNGVKASTAKGAVVSKAVGAGPAHLLIKAKGRKKKTLNETGKVKLNVVITYTPTGGDPATQSTKVKLKKL